MNTDSIPLVKAAYKQQFVVAMVQNGLSPEYYLDRVGLPLHEQEDPESLIPVKPFYHLLNLISVEKNIPDFGAQVAQITPWHKVESLAPLINHSETLIALLTQFCQVAPSQRSHVKFSLEKASSGFWFAYSGKPLMVNDIQMELYRITSMIQLVQLAMGSAWYPDKIHLLMPTTKCVDSCELISKSEVSFAQRQSAIFIPEIALNIPVHLDISTSYQSNNQYDITAGFVDTLRNIIAIYMSNKHCTIALIAKAINMPIRTLQRRLRQYDLCFNDLLQQVKFDLAKEQLVNSTLTIAEIAFQLGYSSSAHFSHAFYRWADMSPSQFRKTLLW